MYYEDRDILDSSC